MFKRDGEGIIIGLILGIVIICFIIYLIVMLAMVIAIVAAAGGMLYGGGYAIKNYFSSFKENVIDSNKAPEMAA